MRTMNRMVTEAIRPEAQGAITSSGSTGIPGANWGRFDRGRERLEWGEPMPPQTAVETGTGDVACLCEHADRQVWANCRSLPADSRICRRTAGGVRAHG
ncbi:MAG TPA: hypothetical protein VNL74_05760, partial [Methylococcus sp.]|nr:hypothetical protein [Methylococcus sp.]